MCELRVETWTQNSERNSACEEKRPKMCIAAFVWQSHPRYPLLLLLNRDEYRNRWDAIWVLLLNSLLFFFWLNSDVSGLVLKPWGFGFCRGTYPLQWWEDNGAILGGRDAVAEGTWLALTNVGKLAFITNVREVQRLEQCKSRGDLPVRFLSVCIFLSIPLFIPHSPTST